MKNNHQIQRFFSFIKKYPALTLIIAAVVWLLFFDRDSVVYQIKISREINQLENENSRLLKKIDSTKKMLNRMNEKKYLERYAREVLLLRKANEDIYLIDTTKYEIK